MRRTSLVLITAVMALLLVERAPAQVILGRVIDQTSGAGVFAVDLQLIDRQGTTRGNAISDSAGWFRLVAPLPGVYKVRGSRLGYQSVTTADLELESVELQLELRMSTDAVVLEPLRITGQRTFRPGRLTGYYDRAQWTRKTGAGTVYTRDDLARLNVNEVNTIFRMTPGLISPTLSNCSYMLDGALLEPDVLNSMIKPEEVEGIEIYRRRVLIPAEYLNQVDDCLALVWTRLDPPGARPFTWKRVLFGASLISFFFFVLPTSYQDWW